MALFRSIEIDSLRVKNILITSTDNKPVPKDYLLYSRGDGATFWSTGVNAAQFITLSTNVSTYHTSTTNFILDGFSTLQAGLTSSLSGLSSGTTIDKQFYLDIFSSLQGGFNSTFSGISTYATNLSTYSTTVLYVNQQLDLYSTQVSANLSTNYATIKDISLLSTTTFRSVSTIIGDAKTVTSTLISADIASNSTIKQLLITTSTNFKIVSTYTGSTFAGFDTTIRRNYDSTQQFIVSSSRALTLFATANTAGLSTGILAVNSTLSSNIFVTNSTLTNIRNSFTTLISTTYFSTLRYTDLRVSSLYYSTTNLLFSTNATTNSTITDLSTSVILFVNAKNGDLLSTVSTTVGPIISTNAFLSTTLSLIISTGVTANIYKSFMQLQEYSAGIVESTVSSANYQIESTVIALTSSYNRDVLMFTTSTTSYIIDVTTNIQNKFDSTVADFTTTNDFKTSTFVSEAISTQVVKNNENKEFFAQFLTSPSIIMHRFHNLSTLSNVSTITGLSSIRASIVNLDLTAYTNFYMLVSDISSDVYYGLTYSTNATVFNKDITLQIDVPSSYANKFVTIDTGNLTRWLNRPEKIYNQSMYGITTKPTPKIYLSTFLGTQLIHMRMTRDALYVKDIFTFPYKYTTLSITNIPSISSNLAVSNPLLQLSSFIYRGTGIPVSWSTNDVNLRLGVKFIGSDINGSPITNITGPYDTSLPGASVRAPSHGAFCRYNRLEFGVYTEQPGYSESANVNQPGQIFAEFNFIKPIYVINPTINSKITIYNPSTLSSFLQIQELNIYNALGENIVNPTILPKYASLKTTNSRVFQGDNKTWNPKNIFDGSQATAFRGGIDASRPDKNAFLSVELSSFKNEITPQTTLSTIVVYGPGVVNPLFTIAGMVLKVENKNQRGIPDGLFFSTFVLSDYTPNTISF